MLDKVMLLAVEEVADNRFGVVLNVLTRPRRQEGVTLQQFYEDLAYEFAEYERAKVATHIDVELNPVNDSALLRFEIKRPKKFRQASLLKQVKHKKKAQ